jgi:hypothetical protein
VGVYGSDIPHRDRLYGAVDVFLKRDAISARRASESCSLTALRAFTGSKIGNVIVQGCDWSKIKRTRVTTPLSIKVTVTAYEAGDYLVYNNEDGTDAYAMKPASFKSMYEAADIEAKQSK